MYRTMLRCTAALVVCSGSLAVSPKAEANWFGLFRTHHQTNASPACCPAPAPVVRYVAPAPVVAAPAPVVAAASPCSTCPAPQPIQVPETCMQTRCYQVPVTRYENRTNYQLVTSNQVSEVMEPVTTIQTSAYYDPCSCGYHNVSTPVTTMVRKQVVTPIQRYVAQHYTVPVTEYVQKCEQVPVTTMRMYVPAGAAPAPAVAVAPAPVAAVAPAPPPAAIQYGGVPAAPQGAPQQQPPGQINLGPNPNVEAMKQVQRENYQQPAAAEPDRRETVDRVYRNGKLVEERRVFSDPTADASGATGSGAPLTPKPVPNASGTGYAVPQDQKPMPKGDRTASKPTQVYSGFVSLSKPYTR